MSPPSAAAGALSVAELSCAKAGIDHKPVTNANVATLARYEMRMLFKSRLPITASEHPLDYF
jgi:hypothetical protein